MDIKKVYVFFVLVIAILVVIFFRNREKEVKPELVKVYIHTKDEVCEIPLEEYLCGVLSAEMPSNFEMEALKAQAVAARTYTIKKMIETSGDTYHNGADICTDYAHCQAWKEMKKYDKRICKAVSETEGEIIKYNGELIEALFHANSGGITENAKEVWGNDEIPYLTCVNSFDEESGYDTIVQYTLEEVKMFLNKEYDNISVQDIENMKITETTQSGRVKELKVGNTKILGTKVRQLLNLRSTNFMFEFKEDKVIFDIKGYGHGVGMSQSGANNMAKEGYSYLEILAHYYKGVEVLKQ